jgi:archaellum component FlaC
MDNLKDVELQVGLLEKDVEQTSKLLEKISESLDKMSEISTNLSRIITLHEQKHEQHEKVEGYLKEDVKELHSRITTVTRETYHRQDRFSKKRTDA